MAEPIIELVQEEKETSKEGVNLLASYFDVAVTVTQDGDRASFIPKANIADMFDNNTLMEIGSNVMDGFDADLESMEEWSDFVEIGLELVKQEKTAKSTPWEGASNFKSPTLMQAALKFSDRASTELLRQEDIAKTAVIGKDTQGLKAEQAERVAEYSNYQLNVEMEEWRDEHEKLLYQLPYDGCAFKKTFFDHRLGRPVSNVIIHPNFVVNNDADSITRLRRFSEIIELSKNEVLERQNQGIWLDVEISFGNSSEEDSTDNEADADEMTTFIEQQGYFDLDGDGYEEPYTFVVEQNSRQVMRITPRFEPSDVLIKDEQNKRAAKLSDLLSAEGLPQTSGNREVVRIKPVNNITKYGFLRDPEGGFLDVGYSYILGALTSGINATTNQLVDAGTLSNRQGGWLAKGFRRKMGNSSFKPGEWKQTGISAQDLHSGVVPLPVKEPSQTLFALMQFMISSSQELSASADLSKALGANAPATTTLALVQEQQQSAGAIILRIYRSMTAEFNKLFVLNSKFLDPQEYQEVLDDPEANFETDFNLRTMNITPVANPEISSKIQRIQQAQAELSQVELVASVGGNAMIIVKNFFKSIGAQDIDEIFPDLGPQEQLQKLLSENPDLAELISGEAERLDLIAASQADAFEREESRKDDESSRKDAETASKLDKEESEIAKNESQTILNLEKAETEDVKNQISTHTAAGQIDNQELQNQQVLRELQQPQELNNASANQAGPTGVE
jgi:chaperonin GroES